MGIARNIAPVFGVYVDDIAVASGYVRPTSATVRYQADNETAPDQRGEAAGDYYWNHRRTCTIECYPFGSNDANAKSASNMNAASNQSFKPGKSITISNAVDPDLNRAWIITDVSKNTRTDGRTTMTLELRAYETHGANMAATEIAV